jgi:hypothetical protein
MTGARRIWLWLDDVRPAPSAEWTPVDNVMDAIELLSTGLVERVSLDHDLGAEETGYDVALYIECCAHDGSLPPLHWQVHSSNPCGRESMVAALRKADEYWGVSGRVGECLPDCPSDFS